MRAEKSRRFLLFSFLLGFLMFGGIEPPQSLAQSLAYVALWDSGSISIIDLAQNQVIGSIPVGIEPYGVTASPDGRQIYVTTADNVTVIETARGTVAGTIALGARPVEVALTPDGTRAFVSLTDGTVAIVDTNSRTVTGNIAVQPEPDGIAVSPDGRYAWVIHRYNWELHRNSVISVIDTATLAVRTVSLDALPYGAPALVDVVFTPDGARAFISGSYDGTLWAFVLDTSSLDIVGMAGVTGQHYADRIAISPDGSRVCVATEGGAGIIDTATLLSIPQNAPDFDEGYGTAFTPDGTRALVTYRNPDDYHFYVAVIDIASNTLLHSVAVDGIATGIAVVTVEETLSIDIDIKPGAERKSINLGSQNIPVAILSRTGFDAPSMVDSSTIRLAGAPVLENLQNYLCHSEDANFDGFTDLVCHIDARQAALGEGESAAVLTGRLLETFGATAIRGEEQVYVVRGQ